MSRVRVAFAATLNGVILRQLRIVPVVMCVHGGYTDRWVEVKNREHASCVGPRQDTPKVCTTDGLEMNSYNCSDV